jgi:ribosome-binding factor A
MQKGSTKAPTQRQLRVGEEIRHALAVVFERGDIRDPALQGVLITITEVRISPDLKNATAFVIPLGGNRQDALDAVEALNRASPFLRRCIAKSVQLRYAPEVKFSVDTSFEQAKRIDQLLRESEPNPGSDPGSDPDPESDKGHGA